MAITSIKGGFFFPRRPHHLGSTLAYTGLLIDSSAEKASFIVQAPKSGDIRKIGWRTSQVTTGGTITVRVDTVNSSGVPSGTLWGTNTSGSQVVNSADDNTWFLTTLTADATVVKGDLLALVLTHPGDSTSYEVSYIAATEIISAFPYIVHRTGADTKLSGAPVLAFEYSDGSYAVIEGSYPLKTITNDVFNSGSSPDEVGIKITVPWKLQVTGFWTWMSTQGASSTYDVKLYNTDGSSVLLSRSGDPQKEQATDNGVRTYLFNGVATLNSGGTYRLTLVPTSVNNVTLMNIETSTSNQMGAMDGGVDIVRTSRADAGAWTDTSTARPMIGLTVDGIETGGSGSVVVVSHRKVR